MEFTPDCDLGLGMTGIDRRSLYDILSAHVTL